jgi:hypothetical protein
MHDGQLAHIDHAQFARRATLSQFALLQFLIIGIILPIVPPRHKGRIAIVTNVGRNAVDAKALTDERRFSRTAKSCGPGAPKIWRSSPSEAESFTRATVANGMVHRGEHV